VAVPAWQIALAGAASGQHQADFEEIPDHGGGVSRGRSVFEIYPYMNKQYLKSTY
jgi:hypothetical protein